MKVSLITGEFPPMPGGVGDFTRILAEHLQALGHDVHVLSRNGSCHETLPVSTVNGWGAGSLVKIRAWIRRINPDVVNLQFQTAAFDMSPFIHFLPDVVTAPVVTTFHDLRFPYLFPKAGPLRDWIVMRLARSSAGVISTNEEDDRRLTALPKRQLIPIGSSIKRRKRDRQEYERLRECVGSSPDAILLGHFGFVKAIKGVDHLVEALAQIRNEGRDLRLVFIGGRRNTVDSETDALYLSALDERIRQLDLLDAIHWTDFLPDDRVAAWLDSVDLVALPFTDGASYRRSSLIAAIHQGCAILTTQPTVGIDVFDHGRNLWLVERSSAEGIRLALAQLLTNPEQLGALRAGALELSRRFDWDRIAKDTIDLYRSCI